MGVTVSVGKLLGRVHVARHAQQDGHLNAAAYEQWSNRCRLLPAAQIYGQDALTKVQKKNGIGIAVRRISVCE
jgi:hypothetical protein